MPSLTLSGGKDKLLLAGRGLIQWLTLTYAIHVISADTYMRHCDSQNYRKVQYTKVHTNILTQH